MPVIVLASWLGICSDVHVLHHPKLASLVCVSVSISPKIPCNIDHFAVITIKSRLNHTHFFIVLIVLFLVRTLRHMFAQKNFLLQAAQAPAKGTGNGNSTSKIIAEIQIHVAFQERAVSI